MAKHKLIDTDEIYALKVGDKLSIYQIAKKLKVSKSTVKYHLAKKQQELQHATH